MPTPTRPPRGNPALAWSALTSRVAWQLRRARVRSTPSVLAEVREHVLLSMPAIPEPSEIEVAADLLILEYLERTRGGRYRGPPQSPALPPVDVTWRRAVEAACDPTVLAVFRLRYGDGAPPAEVLRTCRIDAATLQTVLEGLREVVREEVQARGHPPLSPGAADALLERVAATAGDDCPPAGDLAALAAAPDGRPAAEHVAGCPRCARTVRLLRAGLLTPADLLPPDPWPPATSRISILALHLHPQGRAHLKSLAGALGSCARAVGEDSLLVDPGRGDEWRDRLLQRIRMGLPARDHVRGALAHGPGRWTPRAVLGPVPIRALEASRARTWGEVEGIPLLPDPMPHPPSVARLWTVAILVGLLAGLAGTWLVVGRGTGARWPLDAHADLAGGAVRVRFDVDNRAFVDAWDLGPQGARPILRSTKVADKGALATGEGDFEVVSFRSGVVLVSSGEPLPDLGEILGGLAGPGQDRGAVEDRIRALRPDAGVVVEVRPPVP